MSERLQRKAGGGLRWAAAAAVLIVVTMMISPRVKSDDKKPDGAPEMTEEQMKEMAAWMKFATPGEHHDHLKQLVGTWDATSKFWMEPGAEPQVTQGKGTWTPMLGGRYVKLEYEGEVMGQPFKGVGINGYDNFNRRYVDIWMDTWGTTPMISYGKCDASGKTFTYEGEYDDPMIGGKKKMRSVTRIINKDKVVFEMFETHEGKEFRNLEVTYTRR